MICCNNNKKPRAVLTREQGGDLQVVRNISHTLAIPSKDEKHEMAGKSRSKSRTQICALLNQLSRAKHNTLLM